MRTLNDLKDAIENNTIDKNQALRFLNGLIDTNPLLNNTDFGRSVVTRVWSIEDIEGVLVEQHIKASKTKTREIFDKACGYLSEVQENEWDIINEVISELTFNSDRID